jgi:hypothetical protein
MDCIDVTQGEEQRRAFMIMVMNLQVPQNIGKFLKS